MVCSSKRKLMKITNQPTRVHTPFLPFLPSIEIREYAEFLGLDLLKDSHLLYIAKEGLKAPLPDHWKPCQSKTGEIFYYNVETQESTFEHPCDNYYRGLYLKEKNKKNSNKLGLVEINNDKKGKPLIPPIKQLPSPMFGQQKKPDFSNNTPGLIDKSRDP